MARPKRIVTDEECARLNSLRILYVGQGIAYKDLVKLIREEIGWNANTISKLLVELFIRIDRGLWAFPKEPLYIKRIQKVFDDAREGRQKTYMSKKPQLVEVEEVKDPIQDAIRLLKENGFKVIKEYFNVAEALKNPELPASNFIRVQEF